MITYFSDYCWKNGKPVGKGVLLEPYPDHTYYKIVADPYYRRISVEGYRQGRWESLIYDSIWLDFRKLNERDQLAWQKEVIAETATTIDSLIRDQDDRVVLLEKHFFKDNIPVECGIYSPQGIHLATQKMHYMPWGESFNGVTLWDSTGRVVLKKVYEFDENLFEFTLLLEEIHSEN